MKFSDPTNKTGLIQDCELLLGFDYGTISNDTNLLKTFTRLINSWYRRVNSWIWEVTGSWEYDDSNYTDLPVAITDLVDEQQDYTLPSTAQKIMRVEVLDSDGNWRLLKPIDEKEIRDQAISEFYEVAGLPIYYDLKGNSILLYPKPSSDYVTLDGGLKIYFSRDISEFDYTDTTKEPGFVSNFHRILSLGAAYDYAISYEMIQKAQFLKVELKDMVQELKNFYGQRHLDRKIRIIPRKQNYK